jgi:hypothetical protein
MTTLNNCAGPNASARPFSGVKISAAVRVFPCQIAANAHKLEVNVQVILDKSQRIEEYSGATFLFNSGIPTFIDDTPPQKKKSVLP